MQKIDPRHLLIQIAEILKGQNIPYVVTGGMAVFVWGRPRFTADIDVVIELDQEKISNLEQALLAIGEFGYVNAQAMREALEQNGEFNFIDGNTGMKVDFWVLDKHERLELLKMKRRIPKRVLGKAVYFISPEDLILSKLQWYKLGESTRQLEDIESILAISGKNLDMKYLKKWAQELGTLAIFQKLLRSKK